MSSSRGVLSNIENACIEEKFNSIMINIDLVLVAMLIIIQFIGHVLQMCRKMKMGSSNEITNELPDETTTKIDDCVSPNDEANFEYLSESNSSNVTGEVSTNTKIIRV